MKRPFLGISVYFLAALRGLASGYDDYTALSSADKAFFNEVKTAIETEQPAALGQLVLYPIEIHVQDSVVTVRTSQEFRAQYGKIISSDVKKAVLAQKPDELFKNWRGVMVGRGELWFAEVRLPGESVYRYRIIGISPVAIHK
jgi:hypothetical protein